MCAMIKISVIFLVFISSCYFNTILNKPVPKNRLKFDNARVSRLLKIVETQHLLGSNCTAGTDLNLGEGIVDIYAQNKFQSEANIAVNHANLLTRLWIGLNGSISEYLLHSLVLSMVEFDQNIFAAGNCYDYLEYRNFTLSCPYAFRSTIDAAAATEIESHHDDDTNRILIKDLAFEYKYLSNTSEWFFIARQNARRIIERFSNFSRGYHIYRLNETEQSKQIVDEILSVSYSDGKWSKPYFDCGGGNIWMLTYTVPFFGFKNNRYYFKGTSGIDIDLRRVDIDQCPQLEDKLKLNIFVNSAKCKPSTKCVAIQGLGFRRGSYKCVCKNGYYFPNTNETNKYFNGTTIEEQYENFMMSRANNFTKKNSFECLPCAEGCDICNDSKPCFLQLNWIMRNIILAIAIFMITLVPFLIFIVIKYRHVQIFKAASPVLLCVIAFGTVFMHFTVIIEYFRPTIFLCTLKLWFREIGFIFTYGALMLKTWRVSRIFRIRSAKKIRITDLDLMKRFSFVLAIFSIVLLCKTLTMPISVIITKNSQQLKSLQCRIDLWTYIFTAMEYIILIWGVILCILTRKIPSEFNESQFISIAIYNEFILSVFVNVTLRYLYPIANPDLVFIIQFSYVQANTTLLLVFVFGTKIYLMVSSSTSILSSLRLSSATTTTTTKRHGKKAIIDNKNNTHTNRIRTIESIGLRTFHKTKLLINRPSRTNNDFEANFEHVIYNLQTLEKIYLQFHDYENATKISDILHNIDYNDKKFKKLLLNFMKPQ